MCIRDRLGYCYISLSTLYRNIDLPKAAECIYLGMKYLDFSCNIQEESRAHNNLGVIFMAVSYTHLDVYKRQV